MLFVVCLAIAGSVVAGVHYYTVDLPQQKALQAPANGACIEEWMRCRQECDPRCRGPCQPEEKESFTRCFALCDAYYPSSGQSDPTADRHPCGEIRVADDMHTGGPCHSPDPTGHRVRFNPPAAAQVSLTGSSRGFVRYQWDLP